MSTVILCAFMLVKCSSTMVALYNIRRTLLNFMTFDFMHEEQSFEK